ncbi:hypothetical protein [Parabacteroides sp. PF5-9]|uniref:hypothetical protein n=1 Tax=Parabacteroides sp. PF5-9 TaxID=1742404 RepID=UPI00247488F6|nr:hypothetical protein [Parabacteroides sp. PF5-9]MDH6357012.1 threonine synthase [Parabacteroides sp. PF5-9]
MKKFLFILGLFFTAFLLTPKEVVSSDDMLVLQEHEAVMKEKNAADMQHRLETITKDLRNSSGLTPRRNFQTSSQTINVRFLKNTERIIQYIRLKNQNCLQKVSEYVSFNETTNHSALLTRMRYHVFALRKIII